MVSFRWKESVRFFVYTEEENSVKWFRILLMILLVILLLPLCAWAAEEDVSETPIYEARAWLDFHLRQEPESALRVGEIKIDTKVQVYSYDGEWCLVGWKDLRGWARVRWLWGFHSLDAARYPTPGHVPAVGAVMLERDTWIEGGEFTGMTAAAGAFVCVSGQEGRNYVLPVWRGEGAFSAASGFLCRFVPWKEAQPGDLIGGFTTFYNEKSVRTLAANREYNILLACSRVQGTVLEMGEQFSFNALCGPYTKENDYLMAPNISNDGKGYGGGVCQLTTTLYNAVLGLPLQVDAWDAHRRQGVKYIPVSLDAAVGSKKDFAFTNTLPYPILLWTEAQGGALTTLIYRMLDLPEDPA